MKLSKIASLALAAAFCAPVASTATPLEEAIKDVEVSGFTYYRYHGYNNRHTSFGTSTSDSSGYHRFKFVADLHAKIDDNFFAVLGMAYDSLDLSGEHRGAGGITNVGAKDIGVDGWGQTFNIRQAYLGYTVGGTTIRAGRQELGTFFSDDTGGTGIKVINTDIPGLTLMGFAFDDLQMEDEDIGSKNIVVNGSRTYQNNFYGLAAIGSYDPVSFQLWASKLAHVTEFYAGELTFNQDLGSDASVGVKLQQGISRVSDSYKEGTQNNATVNEVYGDGVKTSHFTAAQVLGKAYGFDGSAGYIRYGAGENNLGHISFEDTAGFLKIGEIRSEYTMIQGKQGHWFLTAGYTFMDKFRVGADYLDGTQKLYGYKYSYDEIVGRFSYQYSKKLGLASYYSYSTKKDKADSSRYYSKDHSMRVQLTYVF